MRNHLLANKTAVIFGAGGNLGQQVVKAYVEQGANVFASSLNVASVSKLSGTKDVQKVDTLNEGEVQTYLEAIAAETSTLDIVTNLSGSNPAEYNHGKPAVEVSLEQFLLPQKTATASQFVTAKAAHKHMAHQKNGVIIFITSTLAKVGSPWSPALTASHAATEGLLKSLANEWGPEGIRVIGVRSEAMPESPTINYTFTEMGKNLGLTRVEMQAFIEQNKTALKRLPSAQETAGVMVLAASDLAAYMTGTVLNHSGGHVLE
ncbi:MAG: SDR family oxidoreductase [Cyanobacteria bacterium P01_D01_bin.6]